jgi:magnesium and cobalt transporter
MPTDPIEKPSVFDRISAMLMREPESREQLITLLRSCSERNLLDADALAMIEGALQVADMQARDIMVPRTQMDVIDIAESPAEFIPMVMETAHSRFPVIGENKDNVMAFCWPRICCAITPARKSSMCAKCCGRRCLFPNPNP